MRGDSCFALIKLSQKRNIKLMIQVLTLSLISLILTWGRGGRGRGTGTLPGWWWGIWTYTHTHANARTHTRTRTHTHTKTKKKKNTKKPFCNKKLSLVFSSWSYGKTFSGPAHVTAFTTVFHGIAHAGLYSHIIKVPQPPSQPSKDVGRFHVATFRPQVAIPGQQGRLNNPRTFFKEKGT